MGAKRKRKINQLCREGLMISMGATRKRERNQFCEIVTEGFIFWLHGARLHQQKKFG